MQIYGIPLEFPNSVPLIFDVFHHAVLADLSYSTAEVATRPQVLALAPIELAQPILMAPPHLPCAELLQPPDNLLHAHGRRCLHEQVDMVAVDAEAKHLEVASPGHPIEDGTEFPLPVLEAPLAVLRGEYEVVPDK